MDIRKPRILVFLGFFVSIFVHWNARMTEALRSKFEVDMRSQITRSVCELFLLSNNSWKGIYYTQFEHFDITEKSVEEVAEYVLLWMKRVGKSL